MGSRRWSNAEDNALRRIAKEARESGVVTDVYFWRGIPIEARTTAAIVSRARNLKLVAPTRTRRIVPNAQSGISTWIRSVNSAREDVFSAIDILTEALDRLKSIL